MAKPTVKSNDAVPPASNNFKNNKTVKKGKAQEFNIYIKQSKEIIDKKIKKIEFLHQIILVHLLLVLKIKRQLW